jgi:hypothetical protein
MNDTTKQTRVNEGKVLATGGGWSRKDCPATPEKVQKRAPNSHRWDDISCRPSGKKGVNLVTSQCAYCGAITKDVPSIDVFF